MSEYIRNRCKGPSRLVIAYGIAVAVAFIMALALPVFSCTHSGYGVRVPEVVHRSGGFYQPWLAEHERHYSEVLACVGLPSRFPRPVLWVIPHTLTDRQGNLLAAYYDRTANVIVFTPYAVEGRERYWLIFRHEVVHSAEPPARQSAKSPDYIHSRRFALAKPCLFWPA